MAHDGRPPVVTFEKVLEARRRAGGRVLRTPARQSPKLAELTGAADIWLKLENWHYAGSFKERGALNALLTLDPEQRRRGVVTASAGNHAQALALHAQKLGVPCKVVMPESTPQVKIQGAKRFGAQIALMGEVLDESMVEARRIVAEEGFALIHPFDDAAVIAGQGTATLELLEDAPDLEIVVIPIGGGGLAAGGALAIEGVRAAGGPAITLVGVEPTMYPSMRLALEGSTERPVGGDTIAEGIAVKGAGAIPVSILKPRLAPADIVLAEEWAIEEAVVHFAMLEKTIAEGAGAAGLAALLAEPERFRGRRVGIILCGGNIDVRLLGQVMARHLVRVKRRVRLRVACPDQPGRLARITEVLRAAGANVIDVVHDRLALDVPAKDTQIDVVMETDSAAVTDAVLAQLRAAGFPKARLVDPGS